MRTKRYVIFGFLFSTMLLTTMFLSGGSNVCGRLFTRPAYAEDAEGAVDFQSSEDEATEEPAGYDLVVIKPFTSKSSKKYVLGKEVRVLKNMLAGYFGKTFANEPRMKTWIAVSTPEEEDAIENALFQKANSYKEFKEIVRFDELDKFAQDHNAHLILLSDISEMSERYDETQEGIGKFAKNVSKTFVDTEMHFILYDAEKKEIIYSKKNAYSVSLGEFKWNDCYNESVKRFGWTAKEVATYVVADRTFFDETDQFMKSPMGLPFLVIYADVIGNTTPIIFKTLGIKQGGGDKPKDRLILSSSTVNDDVRVISYLNEYKKFDTNLMVGHFVDSLPNYNADGAYVAAGDFDGNGVDEIAISAGYDYFDHEDYKTKRDKNNTSYINVFAYKDGQFDTGNPFATLTDVVDEGKSGAYVAAGDFDGDGADELVVSQCMWYDNIKIFKYRDGSFDTAQPFAVIKKNFNSETGYSAGVHVAAGDFNGDGKDELAISQVTRTRIKVFKFDDGTPSEIADLRTIFGGYDLGVYIAAGDLDGDKRDDLIVSAMDVGNDVRVFSYAGGSFDVTKPFASLANSYVNFPDGLFVTAGDLDSDGIDELVVSADSVNNDVRVYKYADGKFGEQIGSVVGSYINFNHGVYVNIGKF